MDNQLRKFFNVNTIKIYYSNINNTYKILNNHDMINESIDIVPCNSRKKDECLLHGRRNSENVA